MGKCLVTKLKAVVDNDNLPVFGQLKFFMNRPDSIRLFTLTENSVKIFANKEATFNSEPLPSYLPVKDGNTSAMPFNWDNSDDSGIVVTVDNFYELSALSLSETGWHLIGFGDLSRFAYCTNLEYLTLISTNPIDLYGDVIEYLNKAANLRDFSGKSHNIMMLQVTGQGITNNEEFTEWGQYVTFTQDRDTYPNGWYKSNANGNPL